MHTHMYMHFMIYIYRLQINNVHVYASQAGCCKPLAECGFSYKSPTVWIRNNSTSSSPDCKAWNNDPKVLCYNCDSCKAGTLEQLLDTWKRMHFLKILFLGFLVLVYSIGCCAFKNTRKKPDYWRQ